MGGGFVMGTSATVGSLNLMTLGIGLLVLIVIAVMFFRKKSNRHPMHPDEGIHSDLDAAARRDVDPPRAKDVTR
ncbi:hypothetical protein [Glacieibacterium sp.]|uniref:hypothetical protein n=1 Tax=Glacieibacterium sp. TaxID=2860237 RepID=UPI003B0093CC